jgi:hypothetical protein
MSTTTAKRTSTRKPAAKPTPAKVKATTVLKEQPKPAPKPKAAKPETPKVTTLIPSAPPCMSRYVGDSWVRPGRMRWRPTGGVAAGDDNF